MNIRKAIKKITPTILFDLFGNYFSRKYKGYVWEGIYTTFKDVPQKGDGFNSDYWIESTRKYTENVKNNNGNLSEFIEDESMILGVITSLVYNEKKKINILEFGGGMGIDYIYLNNCLKDFTEVNYYIVESERVCEVGNEIFKNDDRIHFQNTFQDNYKDLDIIYIKSALQYVENYIQLLDLICQFNPKYILLAKLSAGDNPTFATAQKNVKDSILAYWFLNKDEVIDIISKNGFQKLYENKSARHYNQNNFPIEYRIHQSCSLLFKKIIK